MWPVILAGGAIGVVLGRVFSSKEIDELRENERKNTEKLRDLLAQKELQARQQRELQNQVYRDQLKKMRSAVEIVAAKLDLLLESVHQDPRRWSHFFKVRLAKEELVRLLATDNGRLFDEDEKRFLKLTKTFATDGTFQDKATEEWYSNYLSAKHSDRMLPIASEYFGKALGQAYKDRAQSEKYIREIKRELKLIDLRAAVEGVTDETAREQLHAQLAGAERQLQAINDQVRLLEIVLVAASELCAPSAQFDPLARNARDALIKLAQGQRLSVQEQRDVVDFAKIHWPNVRSVVEQQLGVELRTGRPFADSSVPQ